MPSESNVEIQSPSAARKTAHVLLPGQLPDGSPILSVIFKRTYKIQANAVCARSEADSVVHPGDVPWDDPLTSSVRFESDFVPYKLGTDVVLNGAVHAPNGRPETIVHARLTIANVSKQICAIGDRRANFNPGGRPRFSDPKPFLQMPIVYERAYGGIDVFSDRKSIYPYPRNLLGRGFVVANQRDSVHDKALPNIELPENRLTEDRFCVGDYLKNWESQPMPAGFGWIPKTWQPRASYAGIMPGDKATERELRQAYAKLVPIEHRAAYEKTQIKDMDFRFFNGASSGLALPYLRGDESVKTEHLTPEGRLDFQLPGESPQVSIDIGEGAQNPEPRLHTIMIQMEERLVDLVWCASITYPGMDWLPQLRKLAIAID